MGLWRYCERCKARGTCIAGRCRRAPSKGIPEPKKATERVAKQLDALISNVAEGPDSYRARLRKLAADTLEILDGIDGDPDLEPSFGYFDGCRPGVDECEPSDDAEPDLGAFDRMINQERSWKTAERNVEHYGWSTSQELDDSDHEPSLGSALERRPVAPVKRQFHRP